MRMRALKTFENNQTGMVYPGQIYEVTLLVAGAHERSGLGERVERCDVPTYETAAMKPEEVQEGAKPAPTRRKAAAKKRVAKATAKGTAKD